MADAHLLGGRYRLEHVVGHGGMATVFSAHDTVLERTVAIKLLQRCRDENGVLHERFRREALAEARIVHPNVVTVHDVGANEDGRPYIVMDYVEGRSLSELLADGPLHSERVAVLGIGVARALAAAHAAGVVHRDVKPANILIDEHGIPHLTDFGLARAADGRDRDVTAPGILLGSAAYIAPEQARHGAATPACDLYALGAVLYHSLAGETPFPGESAVDIALRRFEEDPPPLAERVPSVDQQLAALVHRLLSRDPALRPPSAEAIIDPLIDIAARLRLERNGAEDASAPTAPPIPAVAAVPTAAAPDVPQPNATPLPASLWPPDAPAPKVRSRLLR
jgi:eukaryotic-like serine/threonine-protein kinase